MQTSTITVTRQHGRIFDELYSVGTEVTVYEADGFSFPTAAEAEAFEQAPWPRTLWDGRLVTSDRKVFPTSKADQARARQANLDAGASE